MDASEFRRKQEEAERVGALGLYELVVSRAERWGLSLEAAAYEMMVPPEYLDHLAAGRPLNWIDMMRVAAWVYMDPYEPLPLWEDELPSKGNGLRAPETGLKRWARETMIDSYLMALDNTRDPEFLHDFFDESFEGLEDELEATMMGERQLQMEVKISFSFFDPNNRRGEQNKIGKHGTEIYGMRIPWSVKKHG